VSEPQGHDPIDEASVDEAPIGEPSQESEGRSTGWSAARGFLLAIVGAVGFVWSYAADLNTYYLGGFLALGFIGLGFGLAYWGRNLLGDRPAAGSYPIPREPDVEGRNQLTDELRKDVKVITRRRFLTGLLVTAGGLFAASQVVIFGSLGPLPHRRLFQTLWKAGGRLVTFDGTPITSEALSATDASSASSSGFIIAFPEGHVDAADSQVVLMRFSSDIFTPMPGRETWSPQGFVAYSRVCTHAGCSVAQYEDQAHVLVCPCHQSTFDVLHGAKPIFGPAGRALPQLPLMIDAQGDLRAQSDFQEAVGPGFWDLY
jgi:ubiquinol-cytochrome c reductase iron-sulfur subunit